MPGLTIDKFDIGIYIQYARRTELIEQVRAQLHMEVAGAVPAQTLILDLYPKLSELDLLLGVTAMHAPWAYFYPPQQFRVQRRSPFAFHRILPIFGSAEEEQATEKELDAVLCKTPEEESERNILKACFKQMKEINNLLRYIGGRIGQFLQG